MCQTLTKFVFDPVRAEQVKVLLALDQKKRGDRIPTDAQFSRYVEGTRARLNQLADRLAQGVLTPDEYINSVFDTLETAHTEATVMGRRLAGDFAERELDDELFAALVMDGESEYLSNFLTDLRTGRYFDSDGKLLIRQVKARAKQYTGALRATANDTFRLASGTDEYFAWHQLTIEPCDDCPAREAASPYLGSAMKYVPGDLNQQCGRNCGCVIVRLSDGRFGFSRSYD